MNNAYYLTHNGLGDNILSYSALIFLSQFYDTIFFVCKDIYYNSISYIFSGTNIVPVKFCSNIENEKKINIILDIEKRECMNIISKNYEDNDIFVSGSFHKGYLKSKITNKNVLGYVKTNKYKLPHFFGFAVDFYNDIGLDTTIMVDYFNINVNDTMRELYNKIASYKIYLFHGEASTANIDLSHIVNKFINDENNIIICLDKNFYDKSSPKYELAEQYIKLPSIFQYIEIIKNAEEFHMVNSSFACIVFLLKMRGELKCKELKMYNRYNKQEIEI